MWRGEERGGGSADGEERGGGEEQSVEEKGESPFDVWGEIGNKCSRKSCPKTFIYKQVQTRK